MLKNIRILLCLQQNTGYRDFLDIINSKSDNLLEITEASTLYKLLEESVPDKISLVFLDHFFMDKLSAEACSILGTPGFICIILTEDYYDSIVREAYVYDVLAYSNSSFVNNFLIRLEDDLKHRLEYQFLQKKLKKFDDISMKLTTEKNINNLLDLIIDSSMELTYAEAGTIYIVIDKNTSEWSYYENNAENKCLKFVLAKNKALTVDLEQQILSINKSSINGYTVLTEKSARIDDVYNISEAVAYKFNSSFDQLTGYRTKSMLNVPLKDHQGRILGVIQLINKKNKGISIPFDDTDELLASSLAGLAAVAIENAILYKMNEKLLESKTLKLQSTVEELNSAQIQLVQKEKMAAVGQLAAGVAHEINNPLGFIKSNHETMQKYIEKLISLIDIYKDFSKNCSNSNDISNITDYENKSKMEFIKEDIFELHKESSDGLNRIGVIVNALRAFSHIDQVDGLQEYDINQCILDTLTICSSKIKYTQIDIQNQLNDIPSVKCNAGEINQVILNILINAIDAILAKDPAGIGIIRIQTNVVDNFICFEIEDDGIGIPEEIQNRIFEPFYTTKPIGQGTGLGLNICYDIIVKKHHGEILVQSHPGLGSKFTIKLPK
ncbi:MAG: hypothetical protein A2Y23_04040 [Clostridiales bacterium GWB2_37_7]|nr:MAG: hypothetical protein A2Y23_04040 [Clostridiales bacterium GWB2_37_7]